MFNLRRMVSDPWAFKMSQLHYMSRKEAHVGFIGVGTMGGHMANHLLNKGNSLTVYDINEKATENLAKQGAVVASNPAQVSEKSDYVFTMLPSCPYVLETFSSSNGLLSKAKKNTLFIDSSTVHPETSKKLHQLCTEKQCRFIDAPVAGAKPAVIAGTLTFMTGGSKKDIDEATPLLLAMGKKVLHCGDIGSGSVAKICNNLMLAITMIGTSEVLNLAQNLGIDGKLMTEILNISSGRSWSSDTYNPVPGIMPSSPASNDFEGGFKVELMTKDLSISQSIALKSPATLSLGSLAYQIYKTMVNNGYSNKDITSVYKFILEKQKSTLKL